jgi:SPX domain protein involved in polyphosphate accumulation
MQAQRYELKYIVPESVTQPVRAFVSSHLQLDEYASASDNYSYGIHSIYLDSDSLHTYHAGRQGDRNRFKLRIRYYNESPDSPVFLELKRRQKEIIQKTRCTVPRDALMDVLAGDTSRLKTKDLPGHASFCQKMHEISATPRAQVSYIREAWQSRDDNSVRVTIDRAVRAEPCFDLKMSVTMKNPVLVFGHNAILELKFTNRAPNWILELIRMFSLVQTGGPKYAGGIRLYGEHHFAGTRYTVIED